jgi:hypothetical protein
VQDAITIANQAVEKGETSGIALPLDYVQLSKQFGYEQQLTVRLRLPGVDKDQNVMIDTGSSSLAFCDKSLINEAKNISKTTYAQCNTYGSANIKTCPDGSKGYETAFAGQVFQSDVAVYTDKGEEVASMDSVSFAIMELAQFYACFGPLDGIFGVAYKSLNTVIQLPYPDFNISSLWKESCPNPDQVQFSRGYETIGKCNRDNMTQENLDPPLEQALVQGYNSGRISAEAFGLYLDYAAAMGSEVDTIVPSLGIYFGGNLAYDNQFYKNGKVRVAKTVSPNNDDETYSYYALNFTSIQVPGFNLTQSTVDLCKPTRNAQCLTDTGAMMIKLPLPQEFCDRLMSTVADELDELGADGDYIGKNTSIDELVDELKELGSLFLDLTTADGKDDITLSFPLLWLAEQYYWGKVDCTGTTGQFVLGLPITQYYYTVYDMGNKTVSFVELNLSNEAEAFIYGPELGGLMTPPKNEEPEEEEEAADGTTAPQPTPQPTSMGCLRHTIGPSLLAWTVFVPSAVALITSLSLGFI